jgi:protein TonB
MAVNPPAAASGSAYTSLHLLHGDEDQTAFGQRSSRLRSAFGASVVTHGLCVLLVYALLTLPSSPRAASPERIFTGNELVWVAIEGPGGGGGGGGNQSPQPARKLDAPGRDKLTVTIAKPAPLTPPKEITATPPDPPPLAMTIPARPMEAGQLTLPGAFEGSVAAPPPSLGSGTGTGAGTGRGSGSGSGEGSGLGAGSGGGTGGGAYQVGNGVLAPQLIREVKPEYTADAMRAKIQGDVWVSAVVLVDGTVTNLRVVKSLDSTFGLDEKALQAVREWRFKPGTRFGQPVPVQVSIAVSFTLR